MRTNNSAFPVELLADIFTYLLEVSDGQSVISLVPITHVCSSWRAAALGTAKLWTDITIPELALARACFERSGELPVSLSIRSEDPDQNLDPTAQFVSTQLDRIRHLTLTFKTREQLCRFLLMLERAPPSLEEFSVDIAEGFAFEHWEDDPLFPDEVFQMLSPSLGTLSSLSFTARSILATENIPPLLRACPRLEKLKIAADPFEFTMPTPDDIVRLPNLKSMVLEGRHGVGSILRRVAVPRTCHMLVEMRTPYSGHGALPGTVRGTLACVDGLKRLEYIFEWTEDRKTHILRGYHQSEPSAQAVPSVEIRYPIDDRSGRTEEMLRGRPRDVSKVDVLIINGFYGHYHHSWWPDSRRAAWITALRPFNAVRRLSIVGLDSNAAMMLASALEQFADAGQSFAVVPEMGVLELADLSEAEDQYNSVYKMIVQRARLGTLLEVKVRNVAGWDRALVARLMEDTSGKVIVTMDE